MRDPGEASPAAPRTRRRNAADQAAFRAGIIALAKRIFASEGYDALTMRRLALDAGVPTMSLYRYFPSKMALLRHIWDDLLALSFEQARARSEPVQDPCQRLAAFVGSFVDYWLQHPDHYLLVFTTGHERLARQSGMAPYLEQPAVQGHLEEVARRVDACAGPQGLPPALRGSLIQWMFTRCFGLLHPVIYFPTYPWSDSTQLRQALELEIEQHVRAAMAAAGPAAAPPGPQAAAGRVEQAADSAQSSPRRGRSAL